MTDDRFDLEYREPTAKATAPAPARTRRSRGAAHATRVMSYMLIGLGLAMLARTAKEAGVEPALGYIYGLLFIAAGIARLYLARKLGREQD